MSRLARQLLHRKVPVMYRLLETFLTAQRKSRHPARAFAKAATLKRDRPAGKICKRNEGFKPSSTQFGRPVTRAGQRNATPQGWRFLRLGSVPGPSGSSWSRNRRFVPTVDLPERGVRDSIGVAYQAADASHPNRAAQARRYARNLHRAHQVKAVCGRRRLP